MLLLLLLFGSFVLFKTAMRLFNSHNHYYYAARRDTQLFQRDKCTDISYRIVKLWRRKAPGERSTVTSAMLLLRIVSGEPRGEGRALVAKADSGYAVL